MPSSASRTTASGELMSFFIICWVLMTAPSREEELECHRADGAADQRADDGDPGVATVRRALSGDRHERMRDALHDVARRIDGVGGRTAERESDRENQKADEERR